MTRLVGGLLMLARSDAGAIPLERDAVSARSLMESIVEQVEPLAAAQGIEVTIDAGDAAVISCDQDLMLQLLLNLADNAVKYTERGTITMGGLTQPHEVEIFVRDTGVGIPAEHQERIFERFHRVDVARARERGGAGLGLTICKWIAEAHGGRMRVESTEAGSTFIVTRPHR